VHPDSEFGCGVNALAAALAAFGVEPRYLPSWPPREPIQAAAGKRMAPWANRAFGIYPHCPPEDPEGNARCRCQAACCDATPEPVVMSTSLVSRNINPPITTVMTATPIGYHSPL
jgi:hypothetical protein